MAKDVYLSSLSVGRCFKVLKEHRESDAEERSEDRKNIVRTGTQMADPGSVWKVTGASGDSVEAESVKGESKTFPGRSTVQEVARQGYDRLKELG